MFFFRFSGMCCFKILYKNEEWTKILISDLHLRKLIPWLLESPTLDKRNSINKFELFRAGK